MDYDNNGFERTAAQQRLHETLVEILDYVASVCEENGLTYVLAYGTALGAYRHKGFIPWDDDLDIAMPRKDYEKFRRIMHQNPSDRYVIQDENNEENYFLTFAKVRKKNTVFIEEILEVPYQENGIYIDIFPLDYVDAPESFRYRIKNTIVYYLKHTLKFNACKQLYKKKKSRMRFIADRILCLPGAILGNQRVLALVNKYIQGNGNCDSCYIAQYDQTKDRAILEQNVYFPPCQLFFCGKKYQVPCKIKEYLQSQYGEDYMQLPPETERQTHNPVRLEF